ISTPVISHLLKVVLASTNNANQRIDSGFRYCRSEAATNCSIIGLTSYCFAPVSGGTIRR
ncbi:MAG: hypothetical protein ACXWZE_10640, partial [Candidatus Binatia bacterium]